jgi:AcrR family transcriptional regulator
LSAENSNLIKANKPNLRRRNREDTEAAIVQAALAVLESDGFQGLGINTVARQAGCDKQLIYRYFGGLPDLITAMGGAVGTQISAYLDSNLRDERPQTYAELVELNVLATAELIRSSRLLSKILVWEMAGPSELVAPLTQARSRKMVEWVGRIRGNLRPPPNLDAPAINATLISAAQFIAIASVSTGSTTGLALTSEGDWQRALGALRFLVRAAYREVE